jgi:hypothetical protein
MPDLNFQVVGVEAEHFAATPTLLFKLRLQDVSAKGTPPTPIHSAVLQCQIRIEPARRRYATAEKERLVDVFGTPERWAQTLRPLCWTHVSVTVPPFTGMATTDLRVPCSYDFSLAATRYFAALDDGELPLCFLFSGTVFYEADGGGLHVARVPWEKEAYFRLPAGTWRELIERYYPNSVWFCLRKDVFDRFDQYRSREGIVSPEEAIERLLSVAEGVPTP